jgi:DNA-binding NarL/FixJ family response regulator
VTNTPIRVLVVDDHELVRAGLRGVLAADPAIDVVGEASDGVQAVAAVEVHHPDVVVMDLQMPGMGGIEATRRILAARPGTAVLVLTMFDDDDSVFAALRAGARGYLLKGARRDELRAAVVGVVSGQAVFGAGVAARVLDRMTGRSERDDIFPELTPREHEVLTHLVDGCSSAIIAQRMGIADKTVRNNVSSVLTKLHVTDRAAAIDRARRAGIGQQRTTEARYVVFTEMAGSTGLARELGDAYAAVVADHNRIVAAAMTERGGVCFGRAGDAGFAWFRDSTAAIRASLDVHRHLAPHRFPGGVEVATSIGIHYGPVAQLDQELVGLTLHEAVRVAAVGAGGQVVITESALPPERPSGVEFVDLGEQHLPDLDRPIRLFLVAAV